MAWSNGDIGSCLIGCICNKTFVPRSLRPSARDLLRQPSTSHLHRLQVLVSQSPVEGSLVFGARVTHKGAERFGEFCGVFWAEAFCSSSVVVHICAHVDQLLQEIVVDWQHPDISLQKDPCIQHKFAEYLAVEGEGRGVLRLLFRCASLSSFEVVNEWLILCQLAHLQPF